MNLSNLPPRSPCVAWPVAALLLNALIWGLSWWPFRALHAAGLHPLWATAGMYVLMLCGLMLWRPHALRGMGAWPLLWLLAASAGINNLAFNWAVTVGDVVRVVLLFYLMPAWTTLLAWWLLGERPTPAAIARLVMALAGVVLVLAPADAPWLALAQHLSLADALALVGGMTFALTNVTLRRLHAVPGTTRMAAMFAGCAVLGLLGGGLAAAAGMAPAPSFAGAGQWLALLCAFAAALALGNAALQYGAAQLAAGTTALVMLSEVVFASLSSVLIAHEALTLRTVAGGALILGAAALATVRWRR